MFLLSHDVERSSWVLGIGNNVAVLNFVCSIKKFQISWVLDRKIVTLLLLIRKAAMIYMYFGSPTWLVIAIR